jgi:hypothetical protein
MMRRLIPVAIVGLVIVATVAVTGCADKAAPLGVPEQPGEAVLGALGFPKIVHTEYGGKKLVVPSGSELEVKSGGTVDFQSGATTNFASAIINSSTTQLVGAVNIDGAVDLDGVVTNAANLEHILWPTIATASFTYTAAAGGTVELFSVGTSEKWLIHDIRVNVTTNFDATGDDATLVIGHDGDTDGFCTLADAELQAADTEGTGWIAGWQCQVAATRGVFIDGTGGFILTGAQTIDAVIDESSGETLAGGAATVYLVYTRLQ